MNKRMRLQESHEYKMKSQESVPCKSVQSDTVGMIAQFWVAKSSVCTAAAHPPCIITKSPNFLVGSSAPKVGNNTHRFRLYRWFWRHLKVIGVWKSPLYLQWKKVRIVENDPWEILSVYVKNVSLCMSFLVHVYARLLLFTSYQSNSGR